MVRRLGLCAVLVVMMAIAGESVTFAAGPNTANGTITVIHGYPGPGGLYAAPAFDVYLDGNLAFAGLTYPMVSRPVPAGPGHHMLSVVYAGTPLSDLLMRLDVYVQNGGNSSMIIGSRTLGGIQLTSFVDPTSQVPSRQARVVFRDVAVAPPVDVLVDGSLQFQDLISVEQSASGGSGAFEGTALLTRGRHTIEVAATGNTTPLSPSTVVNLNLPSNSTTIIYVTGSLTDGNVSLIVEHIASGRQRSHSGGGGKGR